MGSSKTDIEFSADVLVQRVIEDGLWAKVRTEQAFHMNRDENYGLYETTRGYDSSGFYQFTNWRNFAKWYSPDHLPDYSILTKEVSDDTILTYLQSKEGTDAINNLNTVWSEIAGDDWALYKLQELYKFNAGNGIGYINGILYKYISFVNGESLIRPARVTLSAVTSYTIRITTLTINTITPLSDTEDTKYTKVIDTKDTITDQGFVTSTTTLISEEYTTIPKGSEEGSFTEDIVEEVVTRGSDVLYISINPKPNTLGYISTYTVGNRYKLFVYFPSYGTNSYIGQTEIPSVVVPYTFSQQHEAVPTVLLRSNFFSVDEHDINSKNIDAGDDTWVVQRPSFINEQREYEVDRILNSIGLDLNTMINSINENPDIDKISDSFITFGVATTDYDQPVVSKALFLEFDRIYEGNPDSSGTAVYTEHPYNQAFAWSNITKELKEGVVTTEHDYIHSKDFRTVCTMEEQWDPIVEHYTQVEVCRNVRQLVIQYQFEANRYYEVIVEDLEYASVVGSSHAATIVIRDTDNDDRCLIPITTHMLEYMTPVEMITLLERSMHIVFYASQLYITELEWYQSDAFKWILQIIALVVMVVGVYFGDGGSTGAAIMAFVQGLAVGVALSIAMTVIATIINNPYLKAALMIAATIAASYVGGGSLSLDSFDDIFMSAVKLMDIATTVWTGEIAILQENLMQDSLSFQNQYDQRMEQINALGEQFNTNTLTSEFLSDLNLQTQDESIAVLLHPSVYYGTVFSLGTSYSLLFSSGYDSVNTFYEDKFKLYLEE